MTLQEFTALPVSRAHIACAVSYAAAAVLFPCAGPLFAAAPLALFLLLCAAAPFLPRFAFYLPIVYRGRRGGASVCLTFDDGPDEAVTPLVLDLLAREGVRASFFLSGERARRHPEIVRMILARGHSIGNHTYHHNPWLMMKPGRVIDREIGRFQDLMAEFGVRPLAFRPPAAITNPKLWRLLIRHGLYCMNFSRRGLDMGNRRIGGLSRRILRKLRAGDVIMLHDCDPGGPVMAGRLMEEFQKILAGIRAAGLSIAPPEEILGREIMDRSLPPLSRDEASADYALRSAAASSLYARHFPRALTGMADGHDKAAIVIATPELALEKDFAALLGRYRANLPPGGKIRCFAPALTPRGLLSAAAAVLKYGIVLRLRTKGAMKRGAEKAGLRDISVITAPGGLFECLQGTAGKGA